MIGPTGYDYNGINIWYRINNVESGAEKLEKFTGMTTTSLRAAVKIKSKLTYPARTLKLVVAGSDETEIALDDMDYLRSGYFNFKQLILDHNIKPYHPILVNLPGK